MYSNQRKWKKSISLSLIGCLLALLPMGFALAAPSYLAPGVIYDNLSLQVNGYQQSLRVLDIDSANQYLKIRSSSPKDQVQNLETVVSQAKRVSQSQHAVVGAINGDFFTLSGSLRGIPSGLQIRDGELLTAPGNDAVFGITEAGLPFIETVTMVGTASSQELDLTCRINAVNKSRLENYLVLYTPSFGSTTRTNVYGAEVVLTGLNLPFKPNTSYTALVTQVTSGAGNTPIPKDGVVLSGNGSAAQFLSRLAPGSLVSFSVDLSKTGISQALGGLPRVVIDKQIAPAEELKKIKHAFDRHPRTALGFKDSRLFWVTVDGRQPGYSQGVTLEELGQIMLDLGAEQALNLDGGGSTTMAVRQPGEFLPTLANRPSEKKERLVSNSLQVISTAPQGSLSHLFLTASGEVYLETGITQKFQARGQDEYYNPVDLQGQITWSVEGDFGSIDTEGNFTALRPGQGEIIAYAQGHTTRIPITVTEKVYNRPEFADLTKDGPFAWAKEDIEIMAARGIIHGRGDNLFDPASSVTRAEFTALLVRALNLKIADQIKTSFKDVPPSAWHASYIQAAVSNGLVKGYTEDSFAPDKQISRLEMAVILGRALVKTKPVQQVSTGDPLLLFADYNTIPPWAAAGQELKIAVEQRLIQGISDQDGKLSLAPLHIGNRAQSAVLIKRFYDKTLFPVQVLHHR